MDLPRSIDVFVIGGGPAGLAMAIAARQRGLSVLVVDGMQPPIDKACGEGLMPDGLAALERLPKRIAAKPSMELVSPKPSYPEQYRVR